MSDGNQTVVKKIKTGLKQIYGRQFKSAYLFGRARAIMMQIPCDVLTFFQISKIRRGIAARRRVVGKLSLDYGETVSVVFSRERNGARQPASLMNIRAESIAV